MCTAAVVGLLLVGCNVPYSQHVVMPDGSSGHAIHCHKQVDCWRIAGQECPGGYDVYDKQGYTGQDSYATVNQSGGFAASGTTFTGDMLVKCKGKGTPTSESDTASQPCNSSAQCSSGQTCDAKSGTCVASPSLPCPGPSSNRHESSRDD